MVKLGIYRTSCHGDYKLFITGGAPHLMFFSRWAGTPCVLWHEPYIDAMMLDLKRWKTVKAKGSILGRHPNMLVSGDCGHAMYISHWNGMIFGSVVQWFPNDVRCQHFPLTCHTHVGMHTIHEAYGFAIQQRNSDSCQTTLAVGSIECESLRFNGWRFFEKYVLLIFNVFFLFSTV